MKKNKHFSKSVSGEAGEQGLPGAVISISASAQAFTYVDGVASPTSQTITLTANKQNTTESVIWSASPAIFRIPNNDKFRFYFNI